jgi:hypothetical protein
MASPVSGFVPWHVYRGVELVRHPSGAYSYTTDHVAIDADGSPFAYHPDNIGLDDLRFASWPAGEEDWRWILVADPSDPTRPYVQRSGPAAGYFQSMTSLRSQHGSPTDPGSYVDSETVPYLVFPGEFLRLEGVGGFGDFAMARNLANGRESWAIVADQAPADHPLGELSIRLAENLGGVNVNPRNGDGLAPGPIQYMVFPCSRLDPPWPQSSNVLATRANELLNAIGGWPERLSAAKQT